MTDAHWILTVSVPPSLEEPMVDWLLTLDPHLGFTSVAVSGHSSRTGDLTVSEQVSGRKRQIRFEIHLPESRLAPVLERLRIDFQSAGIDFWAIPVAYRGKI